MKSNLLKWHPGSIEHTRIQILNPKYHFSLKRLELLGDVTECWKARKCSKANGVMSEGQEQVERDSQRPYWRQLENQKMIDNKDNGFNTVN